MKEWGAETEAFEAIAPANQRTISCLRFFPVIACDIAKNRLLGFSLDAPSKITDISEILNMMEEGKRPSLSINSRTETICEC